MLEFLKLRWQSIWVYKYAFLLYYSFFFFITLLAARCISSCTGGVQPAARMEAIGLGRWGGGDAGSWLTPPPERGGWLGLGPAGGWGAAPGGQSADPAPNQGGGGPIGGRPGLGEEPQEVWGPIGALIGPAGLRNACHRDRSFWLFRLFQLFHWSGRLHFIYIDKLYCLLYLLNPFNILMLGCRRLTLTLSNSDAFHSLGIHQYILWNFWFV